MQVLRLKIHQNFANYKKEESITNKMTYPLPPFSTVIGAIHSACKWDTYHEMDLCIYGKFDSLNNRIYTDNIYLNSAMDDRGKLIKIQNELAYSNGYTLIASSKKQGSSFKNKKDIEIHNHKLLNEYIELKHKKENFDEKAKYEKEIIKEQKNILKELKKKAKDLAKGTEEYIKLLEEQQLQQNIIKEKQTNLDNEKLSLENELSLFKTINSSIKCYEILSNLDLIIYVKSSIENLKKIKDNIYNLKAIGRSEDFVDVKECTIIDIKQASEDDENDNDWNTYVNYELIKNNCLNPDVKITDDNGDVSHSTVYYLNKDYIIENNIRKFNKKKVIYLNRLSVAEESNNIFIDKINNENFIVTFI